MIKNVARYVVVCTCMVWIVGCAQGSGPGASDSPKLETEEQKTLYALGVMVGGNVKQLALKPEELAYVRAGFTDVASGTMPQVEMGVYGPKVSELAEKRMSSGSEEEKKKGQAFADTVAKEKDATKTASGIVIRTITPGTGASPTPTDTVKVHYEGKLINGTVFDSSVKKGEPLEFTLGEVVPCWQEAIQLMKKGQKAQVVCPSEVAYGERGAPPDIPPGATLSFEVELLDIIKKP
jgi:FKBP-type peptidyl-prolyl cis-trans isomerase FkpA